MKKTAIITGASGNGIGRSTALTLAREGFQLVINYKSNSENAEILCKHINDNGGKAISVQANVFLQKDCDRLINETIMSFTRIDACIIGPGAEWNPEPVEKLNIEKSVKDVVQEISPVYSLIPRLIPEMKKTNSGRIIAIASNPKLPSPSYAYNTAKNSRIAAILGLVNSCWKYKITINVIAPGPVDHIDNFENAISQVKDFPDELKKISPQDIAEIIAFICSEKGRYLTGNIFEYQF